MGYFEIANNANGFVCRQKWGGAIDLFLKSDEMRTPQKAFTIYEKNKHG
jgi:hypothetical protein